MDFDYQKTDCDLYRAIFRDNFTMDVTTYLRPDIELANAPTIAPLLHPTFEPVMAAGRLRAPDILANKETGKYEPDTGGTSVFDRAGVLKAADFDFHIPEGTDIPPGVKISKDEFNKRLKATHYSIMPAVPMFKDVLMGKLDNLARNAIKRQYEKARGG